MAHNKAKSLGDAYQIMGYPPEEFELVRLVEYYKTYNWVHRAGLLKGFFSGKTPEELVDDKFASVNKTRADFSYRQINAHKGWVIRKINRTIIRIMFLRYTLDKGFTREEANRLLIKDFPPGGGVKDPTSNMRTCTCFKLEEPKKLPKFVTDNM